MGEREGRTGTDEAASWGNSHESRYRARAEADRGPLPFQAPVLRRLGQSESAVRGAVVCPSAGEVRRGIEDEVKG